MVQTSVIRAALLVALSAVFDAVIGPYLTFGLVAPNLTIISIVVAASGLGELQAILLGFFGGILTDALGVGVGLFGVGAIGGIVAGLLAVRVGTYQRKSVSRPVLSVAVFLSVAVYDSIKLTANGLAGFSGPSAVGFFFGGMLPDALLNGLLAYIIGVKLFKLVRIKGGR
ncbi:MAG: rod shape-determining protein MreD [Rubrobacteraceae bacterium]